MAIKLYKAKTWSFGIFTRTYKKIIANLENENHVQ